MGRQEDFSRYLQTPGTVITCEDSPGGAGVQWAKGYEDGYNKMLDQGQGGPDFRAGYNAGALDRAAGRASGATPNPMTGALRFPETGGFRVLGLGRFDASTIGQGISAVYCSADVEAALFKTSNWTGDPLVVMGDTPKLPAGFEDQVLSLEARPKGGAAAGADSQFPPAPAYVQGRIVNQAQIDAWWRAHPNYRDQRSNSGGLKVQAPAADNAYGLPPAAAIGARVSAALEAAYTVGYDSVLRAAGVLPRRYLPVRFDAAGWQFYNLGRSEALEGKPRRYGHGPMAGGGAPWEQNYWFELYPALFNKGVYLDRIAQFTSAGALGAWLERFGVHYKILGDVPSDYRAGFKLSGPQGAIRRLAERDYGNDLNRYGVPAFVGALFSDGPRILSPAALDQLVPDWERLIRSVVDRYNGNNNATGPLPVVPFNG